MKKLLILMILGFSLQSPVGVQADLKPRHLSDDVKTQPILVLHTDKIIKAELPKIKYSFTDITIRSGVSVEEMHQLLQSTTYSTWEDAQAFVDAESLEPSVNAIALLGITKQESLHGRSPLAVQDNNIASIRLKSGKYKHFDSKKQCIIEAGILLSKLYLTEGAEYYNGLGLDGIGVKYCEGAWADDVNNVTMEVLVESNRIRKNI